MSLFSKLVIVVDENMTIVIHNKKEADFMAEQWIKIAKESADLVNNTKKPDVFFKRYDLLVKELQNLSKVQHLISYQGIAPSENLRNILSKRELTINNFIVRYYEDTISSINKLKTFQTKRNKADSFFKNLKAYDNLMLDNNILTYQNLYEQLLRKLLSNQVNVKQCKYCNKLIDINSIYCRYCGNRQ